MLFLFVIAPEEVSARKGDPATANVRINMYTDVQDFYTTEATGSFTPIDVTIPIKKGDVWSRADMIKILDKYGAPEIQRKLGAKYGIYDLVISPDSNQRVVEDTSTYTRVRNNEYRTWRSYVIDKVNVEFESRNPNNTYSLSVNVLANKAGTPNGWKAYTAGDRYYRNGTYLKGMNKIGQTTYLFDKYGAKQFGWHVINGEQVYFNETNGGLWTGKRKIGQTTYLFNSQGHKLYGWHRLNGKDYYFSEKNGGMLTGMRKINLTTYLLHNDGYKIYGWHADTNGRKYYFDPNFGGGMVTGLRKVGNATYFFNIYTGRALINGSRLIDGQSWRFDQHGIGTIRK